MSAPGKPQPVRLRIGSDYLADAQYFASKGDAVASFRETVGELWRYGQRIEATLHYVDGPRDEPAEYPDIVLETGPRGGLKQSTA